MSRSDRIEAIRRIPIFASLDERLLAEVADLLIERRFPKNATIFEEGTQGDYMYLVREGRVKIAKASEDGREKILEILGPGDFFGEMALLDTEPRSASAKTTTPCVLLALSRRDFLSLIRRSPDFALGVIRVLSRRLRETDEQVRALLFERVEARTRRVLEQLASEEDAETPGFGLTPPLTHQQIADLVGTSRETVTRVLKQLRERDLVRQRGKRYLVRRERPAGRGPLHSRGG